MNKNYAFTDIHGNYNLWKQIKEYCDETDKLYFLGDACDRGPNGMRIIREMLVDERITYLKGNHEDFFIDIGAEISEGIFSSEPLWIANGGADTIKDFLELIEPTREAYIRKLNRLPSLITYVNKNNQTLYLSHAGLTPTEKEYREDDLIWDRKHINDTWPPSEDFKEVYVVHGHTPVQFLLPKQPKVEILKYCDGHKFNLDLGTFVSNQIALFDLDTFEVKYFYDKEVF